MTTGRINQVIIKNDILEIILILHNTFDQTNKQNL
jgi:hypothetical protein